MVNFDLGQFNDGQTMAVDPIFDSSAAAAIGASDINAAVTWTCGAAKGWQEVFKFEVDADDLTDDGVLLTTEYAQWAGMDSTGGGGSGIGEVLTGAVTYNDPQTHDYVFSVTEASLGGYVPAVGDVISVGLVDGYLNAGYDPVPFSLGHIVQQVDAPSGGNRQIHIDGNTKQYFLPALADQKVMFAHIGFRKTYNQLEDDIKYYTDKTAWLTEAGHGAIDLMTGVATNDTSSSNDYAGHINDPLGKDFLRHMANEVMGGGTKGASDIFANEVALLTEINGLNTDFKAAHQVTLTTSGANATTANTTKDNTNIPHTILTQLLQSGAAGINRVGATLAARAAKTDKVVLLQSGDTVSFILTINPKTATPLGTNIIDPLRYKVVVTLA